MIDEKEIKSLTPNAALAIQRGELDSEDVRWSARRRMAVWSFRVMVFMAITIVLTGLYIPGGAATVTSMMGVITFLFATFGSIIAGYFGVDAMAKNKAKPKQ